MNTIRIPIKTLKTFPELSRVYKDRGHPSGRASPVRPRLSRFRKGGVVDHSALTDEQLYDLWRAGRDMAAFDAIYHKHLDAMRRRALRLLYTWGVPGAAACAEDDVQETFLRLAQQTKSIPCVRAWLYRVLHNLAVGRVTDRIHHPSHPIHPTDEEGGGGIDPADDHLGPPEELIQAETPDQATQVWECLKELPQDASGLLVLHYFEDLSYDEIAEQTGLPKTTIGSRLYRARQLFLQIYQRRLGDSEGRSQS